MEWKKRWMGSGQGARKLLFFLSGPPAFDGLLCFKWFRNSCQVTGGMWSFLTETGHVGEWDRTSSTKSLGGGVIWMPSKMKQGVPVNFSYICRVSQELFGRWISDNERL